MKPQDLRDLANGLELIQTKNDQQILLNGIKSGRIKKSHSFSNRLNNFILEWFEKNKRKFVFTDIDDFNENDIEGTLKRHQQRYKETGLIHVWTGCSDNTIFGRPEINHYFRAWHDYIHITCGYGYDFIGESIVSDIQRSQLPKNWEYERDLIHCEVVGQAQYNMIHGEFLKDQRTFTINYLTSPLLALTQKQ